MCLCSYHFYQYMKPLDSHNTGLSRWHRKDDSEFDCYYGGGNGKCHLRPSHHARPHDCENSGGLLCRGEEILKSLPTYPYINKEFDIFILFFPPHIKYLVTLVVLITQTLVVLTLVS